MGVLTPIPDARVWRAPVDAAELTDTIIRSRHSSSAWACIREMRLGSGYGFHQGRIDLWVLYCGPTAGCPATAYEVKMTRQDFRNDVKSPTKQRGARLYSNEFYYATPEGLVDPAELPEWAGLMEVKIGEDGWPSTRVKVPAPYREKVRPSWPFVMSLLRRTP